MRDGGIIRSMATFVGWTALAAWVVACGETPVAPTNDDVEDRTAVVATSTASLSNSLAPFRNWHQGFEHDTEGWYGEETPGPIGWCGEVARVDRRSGAVAASAGRAYATVAQSGANTFWATIFGPGLRCGPWAPGPHFAAFSGTWPMGGFVTQLDIYLDPSWTAVPLDPGTYIYGPDASFPVFVNTTVFTYVVAVHDLGFPPSAHGNQYFAVPVVPGGGKLLILGHEVTEPGWYTFRHVFRDEGGRLAVDFDLAEAHGGILFTTSVETTVYGVPTSDLSPADYGSGFAWFVSISPGLELPIDEYVVQRRAGRSGRIHDPVGPAW